MADPTPTPLPGSHRDPVPGVVVVGPADPAVKVSVSVRLRPAAPLPEGVTLTHEQYEAAHGASDADVAAVKAFAADHGLDVQEVSEVRRTVRLSGTVAQMQTAFGATLEKAVHPDGGMFRTRVGSLTVPGHLGGIIEAVMGLDDRPQAQPHFRRRKGIVAHAGGGLTPIQVAAAYSFPKVTPVCGQKIAVISLGGGFVPSTIANYFANLGLPAPVMTVVPVDGGSNSPGSDADVENNLDIEVSGGIYSDMTGQPAHIYFMAAPNTDSGFLDAITTAIHTVQVDAITISWGSAEANWSAQAMQQFDAAFAAAKALGVTVTAASGDNGPSDGGSGLNVDFPSSAPNCCGCGGTRLSPPSETVWATSQSEGTGGGTSKVFARPVYQVGVSGDSRGVPDVSGNADPATGWITSDGVIGGTSAVAPMYAGLVAGLNAALPKNIGAFQAWAYSHPECFRDIVAGGYTSGPGWDGCTGLGSPNGTKLLAALQGTPTTGPTGPTGPTPTSVAVLTLTSPEAAGTYPLPLGLGSITLTKAYSAGTYSVTLSQFTAVGNSLTLTVPVPVGTYTLPVGSLVVSVPIAAGSYGLTLTPTPTGPTMPPPPVVTETQVRAAVAKRMGQWLDSNPRYAGIITAMRTDIDATIHKVFN